MLLVHNSVRMWLKQVLLEWPNLDVYSFYGEEAVSPSFWVENRYLENVFNTRLKKLTVLPLMQSFLYLYICYNAQTPHRILRSAHIFGS